MNLQSLSNVEIPFNKLLVSEDNVRTTRADEQSLQQLAASIQAVGLLQSLVVQPAARGKYAVVAGERRWAALSLLHEAGTIPASYKVPCRLLPKDADPTEASLSENLQRASMEPLDECAAFQRLLDKGHAIADIAARFGYCEALVERRLSLARLSPILLEHYRQGEATLELLQAFTLSADHAQQEAAWAQLPEWNRQPSMVRRLLAQQDIPASDPQVRFVTLAAYEAAGGRTKRDLFADEEGNGVYCIDADILAKLVHDKLQRTAEATQAEGWKWVEIQPEADYQTLGKFRRLHGELGELPPPQQKKRNKLAAQLDQLTAQLDGHEEETKECERLYAQVQELEEQIEAIDEKRPVVFDKSTRQTSGVVVALDEQGQVQVHAGLMRKEDEAALRATVKAQSVQDGEPETQTDAADDGCGYSAALIQSLTTIKTAAIAAELAQQPRLALATVVYTMILQEFGFELESYKWRSCLKLSLSTADLRTAEDSAPGRALSERRQSLHTLLPSGSELWPWCLAQSEETLLSFLAFITGKSIDAIQSKGQSDRHLSLVHADQLARALHLDMNRWYTPTAETFFSRIAKPQIAAALSEEGKPLENETLALKKAQLAAEAETKVGGTGWLPEPLRISPQALK